MAVEVTEEATKAYREWCKQHHVSMLSVQNEVAFMDGYKAGYDASYKECKGDTNNGC